jgi:hypothetical protein
VDLLCARLGRHSRHDASNGKAQRCSGVLAVLIAPALQRVYVCERLRDVSGLQDDASGFHDIAPGWTGCKCHARDQGSASGTI